MRIQKPESVVVGEESRQPWTRAELMARLLTAEWTREPGPAAVYISPAGLRFHLDEFRAGIGILWLAYARRWQLPAEGDGLIYPRPDEPKRLTPRRLNWTTERVYRFILEYKREHAGESPARREIMKGASISSLSVVTYNLGKLAEAGLIVLKDDGRACRIGVPGAVWTFEGEGITGGISRTK